MDKGVGDKLIHKHSAGKCDIYAIGDFFNLFGCSYATLLKTAGLHNMPKEAPQLGIRVYRGKILTLIQKIMRRPPSVRCSFNDMMHIGPPTFDSGGVQAVATDKLHTFGRYMLRQLGYKIQGVEHVHVLLEVLGVCDMKEHAPLERFVSDLLQRKRWSREALGKAFLSMIVEDPHTVNQC